MDLHRQLKQLIENTVGLLRLLQACLHSFAQRLDLAGKVSLNRLVVLAWGVVGVSHEELNDVVHPRADGCASLVDLVKVDKGAVQGECARVDELRDRGAEAVGVADVLEAFLWLDELEVSRGRDYRELAWSFENEHVRARHARARARTDVPRIDTAMGAGTRTSADGNAYDVLHSSGQ